ncbi:MAG: NAD(P)H-hydrate dehydratase, partial [Bryobacteraceae bacterium]
CGKGNNGGDGLAVARQLYTRARPRELHVFLAVPAGELTPDAAMQLRMLEVSGCPVTFGLTSAMRRADVVVDALLGTGLHGPAKGRMAELIGEINNGFPDARIVALDMPSGMASDTADSEGEYVRAHHTVTFTAPKVGQVLPPNCDSVGELRVSAIGSPESYYSQGWLSLVERIWFASLVAARAPGSNKGTFGHVLVVAGSRGKTGAAAMAGMAALRAGAGLVTVATPASALAGVAHFAPELMTVEVPETSAGTFSKAALSAVLELARGKDVVAIGPGLTMHPETVAMVRALNAELRLPVVLDADGLNAVAGSVWKAEGPRILTPHPGEMARLCGLSIAEVQSTRMETAQAFAMARGATVVLKGQRTLIAFPDGEVWINPTGSPAMATGGTGDVLTGLTAGLLAQKVVAPALAVAGAVWLHGRAGELGAATLGEQAFVATDLLRFLPEAMRECATV